MVFGFSGFGKVLIRSWAVSTLRVPLFKEFFY